MNQTPHRTHADATIQPAASDDRFVYQADPEQPLSVAVISAIASQDGRDMMAVADELDPLYNVIDPAALDSLFEPETGDASADSSSLDRAGGSVTFSYAGRTVTVDTTGRVELEDA